LENRMLKAMVPILVGAILVISFIIGACGSPATTASTQTATQTLTATQIFNLKMGSGMASTHPLELLNQRWIDKIQSETNGRVQITLYTGATLIDQFAGWDELLNGVADIANGSTGIPGSPFPLGAGIMNFFYGVDIPGSLVVYKELLKEFPELSAEFNGAKRLWGVNGATEFIHSNKPIRTVADFKGKQFMTAGFPDFVAKMGGTGSDIPMMEVYSALDKGIIDGTFMPASALQTENLVDVTKYSTDMKVTRAPSAFYAMNLDTWNSLPPNIQKVFEDSIPWMETETEKVVEQIQQEAIDFAKTKGHEIIEMSQEDMDKTYAIRKEIALNEAASLDAKGLPGTKIFNETLRLINEYNKTKSQ
jgi:TRAP-type transport system periplasmic protein